MSASLLTGIPFFPHLVIMATCLKLLMLNTYKSTDFDVHRNWLAITYNLPLADWYKDATSIWTLDYPPFFAYFQYALSQIAVEFDPEIVKLSADPIRTPNTITFNCVSVIVMDGVYFYAIYRILIFMMNERSFRNKILMSSQWMDRQMKPDVRHWFNPLLFISIMFVFSPGLMMVDHIHFQYNGMLTGIFLLSILNIMESNILTGSIQFTALLHLKHIYLYAAPAYFVYILRRHCMDMHGNLRLKQLVHVSLCVIVVSSSSILPFVGQLVDLKQRLFPFKRGLTHAYWAPNVWSGYNAGDYVLAKIFGKTGTTVPAYMTGVVQEFDHLVLPSVTPAVTFLLTFSAMIPALTVLWKRCHFTADPCILFLRCVIVCCLSSFLFSWHVHEKAILMSIVPMCILVLTSPSDVKTWIFVSISGTVSLFPLMITTAETSIKILLTLTYFMYTIVALLVYHKGEMMFNMIEMSYLIGFLLLQIVISIILPVSAFDQRLPFLPLALTSLYSAAGILVSFVRCYRTIMSTK